MGMNLMAAVALLPITILTDSFFSPSFPPQNVDYAVIGLGLITVVAYTMFVLSVALFGSVFSSQVGYVVTLTGLILGNVDFWREAVCLDLAFSLCHDYWARPCDPSSERISQDASIKNELTYQAALALLENQI